MSRFTDGAGSLILARVLSGELVQKRVVESVSALFESRLAPLFDSLLERSTNLSTSFRVYESNSVTRARAQNGRIEEVEASNARRLEEVEKVLATETATMKRDSSEATNRIEERVEALLQQHTKQLSDDAARRAQTEDLHPANSLDDTQREAEQTQKGLPGTIQRVSSQGKVPSRASQPDEMCHREPDELSPPVHEAVTAQADHSCPQMPKKNASVQTGAQLLTERSSVELSTPPSKNASIANLSSSPASPPRRRRISFRAVSDGSVTAPVASQALPSIASAEVKRGSRRRPGKRIIEQDLAQNPETCEAEITGAGEGTNNPHGRDVDDDEPDTIE